jgi:hypothetical protein
LCYRKRLGEFRIITQLERGCFGKVYLARRKLAGGIACSQEVYGMKVTKQLRNNVELEVFTRATGNPYRPRYVAVI